MRVGIYLGRHPERGGMKLYAQSFVRGIIKELSVPGRTTEEFVLYGDSSVLAEEFLDELRLAPVLVGEQRGLFRLGAAAFFRPLPNGERCRIVVRRLPEIFGRMGGYLLDQLLIPLALRLDQITLLHSLSNTGILWGDVPQVITVHDLYQAYPVVDHQTVWGGSGRKGLWTQLREFYYRLVFRRQFRSVQQVIADSTGVAKELCARYPIDPARVRVISLGLDEIFSEYLRRREEKAFEREMRGWREGLGLPSRYVLTFASTDPRKNLLRTLQAFLHLAPEERERTPLIVILTDSRAHTFCQQLLQRELEAGRALILSGVSRVELARILDGAAVTLVPTLAEGFGFPAFESLAFGVAVVSPGLEFFRDFSEALSWICDPLKQESIDNALKSALGAPTPAGHKISVSDPGAGRGRKSARRLHDAVRETITSYRQIALQYKKP